MHRARSVTALIATLLVVAGCEKPKDAGYLGYIEGEFVLLASPYAGQLQKLSVRRGDPIDPGKPVFVLEQESEKAAREEAEKRLDAAKARLANLKVPRRPPEIEAIREQVNEARAAEQFSRMQLAREEDLMKKGYTTRPRLDEARAAHMRDQARVKEADAQLRNAQMPIGRDAERAAAEAEASAARSSVEQAQWRLAQKSVSSPVGGRVQDTFFVEGEWVPAGRPVASILPPNNVKARFYVPETAIGALAPGSAVEIRCDGCAAPIAAKITFVSGQAEYTPPVLYSKESRTKLLFLVEARPAPADAAKLRPGQPVDVLLK